MLAQYQTTFREIGDAIAMKDKHTRIALAFITAALVFLAACAAVPAARPEASPAAQPPELQRLRDNRKKWESGAGRHYRARISASFFGPREWMLPLIVEVKQGVLISFSTEGSQPMPASKAWADFADRHNTIEKVFGLIEKALADKAERVEVDYDPVLGFPARVVIDPLKQAADDETYYTIDNVAQL